MLPDVKSLQCIWAIIDFLTFFENRQEQMVSQAYLRFPTVDIDHAGSVTKTLDADGQLLTFSAGVVQWIRSFLLM